MENPAKNRVADARATFNHDGQSGIGQGQEQGHAAAKHYRCKVFKSGNSLALRLPAALGMEKGMEVELTALADGSYTLRRPDAPRRKIDGSKWIGKAPWLKPLTPEDRLFEHSPRPWDDPDWPESKAGD